MFVLNFFLSKVFQIVFLDFQNWGGLVLLLLGSEVGSVGHHLFCVVWMLYEGYSNQGGWSVSF